jgi:hypothetical protein
MRGVGKLSNRARFASALQVPAYGPPARISPLPRRGEVSFIYDRPVKLDFPVFRFELELLGIPWIYFHPRICVLHRLPRIRASEDHSLAGLACWGIWVGSIDCLVAQASERPDFRYWALGTGHGGQYLPFRYAYCLEMKMKMS